MVRREGTWGKLISRVSSCRFTTMVPDRVLKEGLGILFLFSIANVMVVTLDRFRGVTGQDERQEGGSRTGMRARSRAVSGTKYEQKLA